MLTNILVGLEGSDLAERAPGCDVDPRERASFDSTRVGLGLS
jgi:hypothetical protein